ncbi:hypothetical protein SVAN01_05669 [Stagonosporopsis vannaccii]|nr:hypothetical protein SVAN01_05669 [Stagonosporopsis vannaccii]
MGGGRLACLLQCLVASTSRDSLVPIPKNGTAHWHGDLTKTLVQSLQARTVRAAQSPSQAHRWAQRNAGGDGSAVHDALAAAGARHSSCKSFTARAGGRASINNVWTCGPGSCSSAARVQDGNRRVDDRPTLRSLNFSPSSQLGFRPMCGSGHSVATKTSQPSNLGTRWADWSGSAALERPALHIAIVLCFAPLCSFASSVFSASREFLWPPGKPAPLIIFMSALAAALRACGLVGARSQVTHIFGADCALAIVKHCDACIWQRPPRASIALLCLLPAACCRRAVDGDALLLPTLVDTAGLSPRATPVHSIYLTATLSPSRLRQANFGSRVGVPSVDTFPVTYFRSLESVTFRVLCA